MASASCHKVIVDCDPGVDDAQAIIMLLAQKHIQVVAITTVFGNEPVESTSHNALRVLKMCKRLDVPVFKGCASPLTVSWSQDCHYDLLGKAVIPNVDPIDTSCVQPEHASVALCRLVSEEPGSITLLSIAPLTNIAVALMLDPSFGNKLKSCVMMGGNYYEGEASITYVSEAEFNWRCDPEAAHAVLAGLNKVITLLPFETCIVSSLSWEWYRNITQLPNAVAQFVQILEDLRRESESKTYPNLEQYFNYFFSYFTWDQIAAAYVIDSAVVCESKNVHATVELRCAERRGYLVVDVNKSHGKMDNVCIVTKVNQALYEKLITAAFSRF